MANFTGTSGNNVQDGTNNNDDFDYSQGGQDRLHGLRGDDVFFMGGELDAGDRIVGGSGYDFIVLNGDYSGGIHLLDDNTFRNVEQINLEATGTRYEIGLREGNIAAGETLTIVADASTYAIWIDASFETDGSLVVYGSDGFDSLSGGAQADYFLARAGTDDFDGFAGDDTVEYGDDLAFGDVNYGGLGYDRMIVNGDYSTELLCGVSTISEFEELDLDTLGGGFSYSIRFNGLALAEDATLLVEANTASNVSLDASFDDDSNYIMHGSAGGDSLEGGGGGDTLVGGAGFDVINGNGARDILTGGADSDLLDGGLGQDVFRYTAVSESTGLDYDAIVSFDANKDDFLLTSAVNGVDQTVSKGHLDSSTFDADLAARIDAGRLGAKHAVLFNPDSGNQAGFTFLVIDMNNTAGYQAGQDLVMALVDASHLHNLSEDNFGHL